MPEPEVRIESTTEFEFDPDSAGDLEPLVEAFRRAGYRVEVEGSRIRLVREETVSG